MAGNYWIQQGRVDVTKVTAAASDWPGNYIKTTYHHCNSAINYVGGKPPKKKKGDVIVMSILIEKQHGGLVVSTGKLQRWGVA